MLTRSERASLDLRHHRGDPGDLGVADDASGESRADDAQVEQILAARQTTRAVEEREPADVPLPHGERSTLPSAKTVTFRWISGSSPSSCQKTTP
jgi:hypothetical protein